jgi:hypothetical protein
MTENHFLPLLTTAHATLIAYERGARTLPELSQRTGLKTAVVAEWSRLFKLPISISQGQGWRLGVSVVTGSWVREP